MKKRDITIYDIAKDLNVSPSTISRALKDHHSIGKATKKRVLDKAAELGYLPNKLAASLRNNKTMTIGVCIPWINRPFIGAVINGIESMAKKEGYNVILSQSKDSYEHEKEIASALLSSRVEGLIVSLAMETKNYDHFKPFLNANIPVVFVDRVTDDLHTDIVVIDNKKAAYAATEHLIEQGCKRIAHFTGSQHRNIYRKRKNGFEEALLDHNLEIDESLILEVASFSALDGYKATEKLLSMDNPPDGLFASNDTSAVSAIQCAKRMGVKVPEEFAVIGFNNDPVCTIVEPSLSSMFQPGEEMGEIAAMQLIKKKNKEHGNVETSSIIKLKTSLTVRESSSRKNSIDKIQITEAKATR